MAARRVGARFRNAFRRARSGPERGRLAEEEAARFLECQGFEVIERNVRTRVGEIDLIALESGVVCFVEVKARAEGQLASAVESVDPEQRRRIVRAASLWLARSGWEGYSRFDVVALDVRESRGSRSTPPRWQIRLLRDAFEAEESDL